MKILLTILLIGSASYISYQKNKYNKLKDKNDDIQRQYEILSLDNIDRVGQIMLLRSRIEELKENKK